MWKLWVKESRQGLQITSRISIRHRCTMNYNDFEDLCHLLLDSEDELESDEKSEPVRAIHASSIFIDQFVNANIDSGMECTEIGPEGDFQHIVSLLHSAVRVFLSTSLTYDGCAVSGCYDKKYSVYWGSIKDTSKLAWTSCKVLSMKPIFKCLLQFILRGHKKFGEDRMKSVIYSVDDIEAFNILLNLRLVHFIEPDGSRNIIDKTRERVAEIGALLVSSSSSDVRESYSNTSSQCCVSNENYLVEDLLLMAVSDTVICVNDILILKLLMTKCQPRQLRNLALRSLTAYVSIVKNYEYCDNGNL
ncbi:hypothetical protein DICVIV_02936 [Dictyocaulus viviparus]|uniref:Zc3h12a-like Ribonuclease NYN domain-containing protein n=1 Tax=Dictyocaulus viviparus TaxID=29172 RepID=A0A0D8Y3X2_DICVI|nr:hypothetical protein DICVIV_02936 [Dictyocaulus viviparus]